LLQIAPAVENVIVSGGSSGKIGFGKQYLNTHVLHQKLEQALFKCEETAYAVSRLAQTNQFFIFQNGLKWLQVVKVIAWCNSFNGDDIGV